MLQGIRHVLDGQIHLSGKMSIRILDAFSGDRDQTAAPIGRLTDRELEILQLTGEGKDSHDIARLLNLSFKTVDAHRGHIKEKLKLRTHTELVSYAARWVEAQPSASQ
jgi:DNA-binding NarL/FixJ family response regulator